MYTPKLQDALLLAFAASQHTLNRCRGGWFDRSRNPAPQGAEVVTTRTANALVDMGLAAYDDPRLPCALALTAHGTAQAAHLCGARKAA